MNPSRPSLKFADATVLQDWFAPMMQVLQKVRFSDGPLSALPTAEFILSGCLRQLLDARSLRDFVQTLFHQGAKPCLAPIARSTWADALAPPKRCGLLRQALALLVAQARATLTRQFLLRQQTQLNLSRLDSTQQLKHNAKLKEHQNSDTGISLRATWTELSKITRQLWRFLKHCFAYPSSLALYQRQLAPILERYL